MDDLITEFLIETNENLGALDDAILRLEQDPGDSDTVSRIFRLMHTIKGTCGFLGLSRLEAVAHAAENVLGRCRDGVLVPTPETITVVLGAIDRIRAILGGLEADKAEPEGDDAELIAALDAAAAGEVPPAAAEASAVEVEALPAADAGEPSAPPPASSAAPQTAGQTIRVGVEVLENLMTLVSELVLARNQLLQLARAQEDSPFDTALQRLSHITSELQEGVMKARMQPIGHAWNKLPRLVRDLSRDLGKRIALVMLGAETELDRQVLEMIRDPLTHMVRNSADHGIETPADRRASGKPEVGRLTLNAYHEGGYIIITVGDDGRGLPLSRIRAKALANRLCTEEELARMTEAQVRGLIFRPGFSTAEAVTAVSGRGVGMDVVRTNVERIGGTIDVHSVEGQGSTFTIRIPITLAIVSALIVEAGGERFAVPQISVVELVRAGTGAPVERVGKTPVLRLRDRLLPVVRLSVVLGLAEEDDAPDTSATVVVTRVGAHSFGIIVDRVFDTEEIVVKPLAPILRHLSAFGGNTILGDGSVIMILDPTGIARAAGVGVADAREAGAVQVEAAAVSSASLNTKLLLFRADGGAPKAVPLELVSRIEDVPRGDIELSNGREVLQYRGRLLPLVRMGSNTDSPNQPILVFADRGRLMGLLVDGIVDIVEETLRMEQVQGRAGYLGSAVVAGQATDIVDIAYWLAQADEGWFARDDDRPARRILAVDDSLFFRQMLVPLLAAEGYEVTAVASAAEALRLRDTGAEFDAILTDIEMPGMDGYALAAELRREGPWQALPMVALTSFSDEAHVARGRSAGLTAHVVKVDREGLLLALARSLARVGEEQPA